MYHKQCYQYFEFVCSKSRSSWLNTAASEYERERAGMKTLLNLIVVGHVDAGKSTLMGHLLYKLGQVSAKQMHKYEQVNHYTCSKRKLIKY